MKLSSYLVPNCLEAGDWRGAVAALADHFRIALPANYRLDLLVDFEFIPEIAIWSNANIFYSWKKGRGFYTCGSLPSAEGMVKIYMPARISL